MSFAAYDPRPDMCPPPVWRLTIWVPEEQAALPWSALPSLWRSGRSRSTYPAALLDIRAVKSSMLERNVLRIGDVFAL
jgi:hypothetical protein